MNLGEHRPSNGILGIYHFNGNSTDSSGNNKNGTDTNITYSRQNGKIAEGAGFNGSTSYIDIPNNPSWTSWYLRAFIKFNSLTNCVPVSKDDVAVSRCFALEVSSDGSATLYAWNSASTIFNFTIPAGTFTSNKFQLLELFWDSANNQVACFVDNKNVGSAVTSGQALSGSMKITLGRQNTSTPAKYLNGCIDELVVMNYVPSLKERKQYYALIRGKLE